MKIMYVVLVLIMVTTVMIVEKGGEKLMDSPYVLEQVSEPPVEYEITNDTSQVWKVTFVSLRYCDDMFLKDLDSLYSEAFTCMDQFMFFAEQNSVIVSNPSFIEVAKNKDPMSFLFSVSKRVDKEKLIKILEESFFGSPTKKADASRLFPFSFFLKDLQMIHILPRFLG